MSGKDHKMKKILAISLLLAILAGCNTNENETQKTITISIAPQKYFAKALLPDNYDINMMVPPGASPATYEPTPKQLQKLSQSEIYVRIGKIEFEQVWMPKIKDINPELKVVDASEGVDFIEDGNGHGHVHEADPHIWTSPILAKQMTKNMSEAFIAQFPEDKEAINKNTEKLLKELEEIHQAIQGQLAAHSGKAFLIYHPALAYFARDYELRQMAIEHHGKEPSASDMTHILEKAKKENISTVFIQQQFDQRSAVTIADEIGAEVVVINPLSENWKSGILDISKKLKNSFE